MSHLFKVFPFGIKIQDILLYIAMNQYQEI